MDFKENKPVYITERVKKGQGTLFEGSADESKLKEGGIRSMATLVMWQ